MGNEANSDVDFYLLEELNQDMPSASWDVVPGYSGNGQSLEFHLKKRRREGLYINETKRNIPCTSSFKCWKYEYCKWCEHGAEQHSWRSRDIKREGWTWYIPRMTILMSQVRYLMLLLSSICYLISIVISINPFGVHLQMMKQLEELED